MSTIIRPKTTTYSDKQEYTADFFADKKSYKAAMEWLAGQAIQCANQAYIDIKCNFGNGSSIIWQKRQQKIETRHGETQLKTGRLWINGFKDEKWGRRFHKHLEKLGLVTEKPTYESAPFNTQNAHQRSGVNFGKTVYFQA